MTNYSKRNIKERIPAVIAGILLLLLYSVIFSFSAQDGETSGGLSDVVSRFLAQGANFFIGNRLPAAQLASLSEVLGYPVRKAAHFGEYAVMGILIRVILYREFCGKKKKWFLVAVLWVLLSAAADEWHQYFVPGRCASIRDVLLDTSGGICGILLCSGIISIKKRPGKSA